MRDYLEVVARPEGVIEAPMTKGLVCRTTHKVEPLDPSHPNFLANLELARETAKALDWGEATTEPNPRDWQMPSPRMQSKGSVYFIGPPPGGRPIKIGWTGREVQHRFHQIQAHCPYDLKVLAVRQGTLELEAAYHRRFTFCWLRGEWFEPHWLLLREIEKLNGTTRGYPMRFKPPNGGSHG